MRLITPLLGIALLVATSACKSTEHTSFTDDTLPCICGTPEADFDGCHCTDCCHGDGSSENPDCVCGPLAFEKEND